MKKSALRLRPVNLRMLSYSVFTFVMIAWLTLAVNLVLFFLLALRYHQYMPEYITGEEVMGALTQTGQDYVLHEAMQERLDELGQWAMLLNEEGEVIWSYEKPAEIRDSFTRSAYSILSRISEILCYISTWIEYCKRIWYWLLLFDFLWILALAVVFTRRFLRSREAARIEWIAGISHDIRTPLSVALGYADTLESSDRLMEDERQQAAVIRHQCLVMKELVEDLNLTSRLEYSMQALGKEEVHPAAVLREVAAGFLDDAEEGTLEIEMDIDRQAEEIVLMADRKLLVRALRNLFHNSLRHSEQAGAAAIRLSLRDEKYRCCITFSDNGIGYSREMLRRLNGRRRKRPAQNIRGLGIVCKIVQAHGGKIFFGNGEEGGTFSRWPHRRDVRTAGASVLYRDPGTSGTEVKAQQATSVI